jgi:hypothetical protein
MSHARQQIREAFATALGNLASAPTVYQWRAHPIAEGTAKALRISTPSESVETDDALGAEHERTLTITVEIVARTASDVDDTIDTLCVEVEELTRRSAA